MNDKQQRYAQEYVKDHDRARAYRIAYPKCMSDDTASKLAARLMKNDEVSAYIAELEAEICAANVADAQEVMEYLTAVMRREKTETVVVTLTNEISEYVPDAEGKVRQRKVRSDTVERVEIPSRLSDANKAAELLGKRFGMWTENVQLNMEPPKIVDDIPSEVE